MELMEVNDYAHKIKRIDIRNDNFESASEWITFKIHLDDVKDYETIRFSHNGNFLSHQSMDGDYFVYMPNILGGIITIYAHYYIRDLYDYEEDTNIFFEYDLTKLLDDEGDFILNVDTYDMYDEDDKLYVRSLLENSVDRYKNPNYKQYSPLQQGFFPFSSRYRPRKKYLSAPNLSTLQWSATEESVNCQNRYLQKPFWEAKIHRNELAPIITDTQAEEDGVAKYFPINAYLNYNYLPTSTEWHQHYYGFEEQAETQNKDFNVFEGTDINIVNPQFGSSNNYRIINAGNPFDDRFSMFVNHKNNIPIDLSDEFVPTNCEWKKNKCEKYFSYRPKGIGKVSRHITLKEGSVYSLKYYIYIPAEADVEADSCYVAINGNKIPDIFIAQDKTLRQQWVYHEVPFVGKTDNVIDIIGPQHDNADDEIFFINLSIEEFPEFSPTLKYTGRGLFVVEQDKYAKKPLNDLNDNCVPTDNANNEWHQDIHLPIPVGKVTFSFDGEIEVQYDNLTTNLTLYRLNTSAFDIEYDNYIMEALNEDATLAYDSETKDLSIAYKYRQIFVRGSNNSFSLRVRDIYGNPVTSGEVECAIFRNKDSMSDAIDGLVYIGKKNVQNGRVYFGHINLKDIESDGTDRFYLRIQYTNKCYDKDIIDFKTIYIESEIVNMSVSVNGETDLENGYSLTDLYNDLPLEIEVHMYNQVGNSVGNGYCELSIDDKVVQTSMIDKNGYGAFYLDIDDITASNQAIKITYYNRFFEAIKVVVFNLIKEAELDLKPAIPVQLFAWEESEMFIVHKNEYVAPITDCILIDIDTVINKENSQYINFRLEVYRHDTPTFDKDNAEVLFAENILDYPDDSIAIFDGVYDGITVPSNNITKYYTIITKDMESNGMEIRDEYRTYQRTIKVRYEV